MPPGTSTWASGRPSGSTSSTAPAVGGALGDVGGQLERDRAAGLVEDDGRRERARDQQLEVVELARGRAVLRDGGHRHTVIVPSQWSYSARMSGPVVVAELVRSGFVEGRHYGSVVALDARRRGRLGGRRGHASRCCRARATSRSRPLAMVRLGLDLPPDLLALACASHSGEPFHLDGVRRILASAGLPESSLQTPAGLPARRRRARRGPPRRRRADAAADELLGQARGDARDLRRQRLGHRHLPRRPTTRCSTAIRATFEELTGEPVAAVAVDGCGAPLLSTSLVGLARAFRRLALATDGAERRVAEAIRAHPEWVSGTRRDELDAADRDPGRDRQDGRGVVLRRGARRRPGLRAQDRRRRDAGASGGDGGGAASLGRGRRARRGRRRRAAYRRGAAARAVAGRSGRSARSCDGSRYARRPLLDHRGGRA